MTYTHVNGNDVTFEDIEYIDGQTNYSRALDVAHHARNLITTGTKDAVYAVIHHIYEVSGVKHRHV